MDLGFQTSCFHLGVVLCSKDALEVDLYSMDVLVVDLSMNLVVPILVVLLALEEVLCSLDDPVVVL